MRAYLNGLIVGLSRFRGGFNALWVIIDQLTKLTYFISIKESANSNQLEQIYVTKIMRL